MSPRVFFHLAWATIATGAILLEVLVPTSTNPGDQVWPLGLLPFPLAGALLLVQRPGNRIGLVLAAIGLASGVTFAGGWAMITWYEASWSPYLEALLGPMVVVMFWGPVALLYLLPTGETRPGWPRWVFGVVTAISLGFLPLLFVLRPGPLDLSGSLDGVEARDNPLGIGPQWLADLADPGFGVVVVGGLVGLVALGGRFRRASGVERAQLKVFMFGAIALVVLLAIISGSLGDEPSRFDVVLGGLVVLGFWGLPVAVVAAVLRYRLYEIDRLVGRTMTYVVVVAALAAVYAGLVVALGALLPIEGDLPVTVSTLVVAFAFLPLVRRVQRVVDRRFFRSRYDAGVVVARVADELRGSLDLAGVTARVGSVVEEVFAPEVVGLWVADGAVREPPGPVHGFGAVADVGPAATSWARA